MRNAQAPYQTSNSHSALYADDRWNVNLHHQKTQKQRKWNTKFASFLVWSKQPFGSTGNISEWKANAKPNHQWKVIYIPVSSVVPSTDRKLTEDRRQTGRLCKKNNRLLLLTVGLPEAPPCIKPAWLQTTGSCRIHITCNWCFALFKVVKTITFGIRLIYPQAWFYRIHAWFFRMAGGKMLALPNVFIYCVCTF